MFHFNWTGSPGKRTIEYGGANYSGQNFADIATKTKYVGRRFMGQSRRVDDRWCYRFNVDQGSENIGLDEYRKRSIVQEATNDYVEAQELRVLDCIQSLMLMQSMYTEDSSEQ